MSGNGRGRSRKAPQSLPPCEAAEIRKRACSRCWAAMHKARNCNRLALPPAGNKLLSIPTSRETLRMLTIA